MGKRRPNNKKPAAAGNTSTAAQNASSAQEEVWVAKDGPVRPAPDSYPVGLSSDSSAEEGTLVTRTDSTPSWHAPACCCLFACMHTCTTPQPLLGIPTPLVAVTAGARRTASVPKASAPGAGTSQQRHTGDVGTLRQHACGCLRPCRLWTSSKTGLHCVAHPFLKTSERGIACVACFCRPG